MAGPGRPGRKPKGKRYSHTVRFPEDHRDFYAQAAADQGLPLGDYVALCMARLHDLAEPDYINPPLPSSDQALEDIDEQLRKAFEERHDEPLNGESPMRLATRWGLSEESGGLRVGAQVPPYSGVTPFGSAFGSAGIKPKGVTCVEGTRNFFGCCPDAASGRVARHH